MVSKEELNKRRVRASKNLIREEYGSRQRRRRDRMIRNVGGVFFAFVLLVPLAAGFFAATTGGSSSPAVDALPLVENPPSLVDEGFEGITINGPTPCPSTDGTQQRATSFDRPPPMCIDTTATFETILGTAAGDITINLDVDTAPEANNLFVSLARFGVYDGAPITPFDGVVIIGGIGDAGFEVAPVEPPADGEYPVGSFVMLSDLDGTMKGRLVLVTGEAGARVLAEDPTSPIVGHVTSGLDVAEGFAAQQLAEPAATQRIQTVTVTQG